MQLRKGPGEEKSRSKKGCRRLRWLRLRAPSEPFLFARVCRQFVPAAHAPRYNGGVPFDIRNLKKKTSRRSGGSIRSVSIRN